MRKYIPVLLLALSIIAPMAFGSQLVSVSILKDASQINEIEIANGIADDGFASPQAICYKGTAQDVCALAKNSANDRLNDYKAGNHGYIQLLSCVVHDDDWVDLNYQQITDWDGESGHHQVQFKISHCLN